jgi:hypothetical protein
MRKRAGKNTEMSNPPTNIALHMEPRRRAVASTTVPAPKRAKAAGSGTYARSTEPQRCYACNETKPADAFATNRSRPRGIAHMCRVCYRRRSDFALEERRANKEGGKCANCGYQADARALCFELGDSPKANAAKIVSRMAGATHTAAMQSSILLCRNCVRLRRYPNFAASNKSRGSRHVIAEKLRRGACIDCKLVVTESNSLLFEFDHRDALSKIAGIGRLSNAASNDVLTAEMNKCDLRCSCCHYISSLDRRQLAFQQPGPPMFQRRQQNAV